MLIALIVGLVGVGASALAGHVMMGVLGCVGLVLGLVNARLVQRSVVKVIGSENPTRKALSVSSAKRLVVITLLAVAFGIFLRPDGIGVFIGLAASQFIINVHNVLPAIKELRQHE